MPVSARDGRRHGFYIVYHRADDVICARWTGRERTTALAIYHAIVRQSSVRHRDGGRDGFPASRGEIAAMAGSKPATVDLYVRELVELGLVSVERQRDESGRDRPSCWVVLDAPDENRSAVGVTEGEHRGSFSVTNGSSSGVTEEEQGCSPSEPEEEHPTRARPTAVEDVRRTARSEPEADASGSDHVSSSPDGSEETGGGTAVTTEPSLVALEPHEAQDESGGEQPRDDVQIVFDIWLEATGRTTRTLLSPKRRRIVRKALSLYSLQEVIDAVTGWRHSPHHCGENDRNQVYNDIELLLRDSQQIEKFRDLERHHREIAEKTDQAERSQTFEGWQGWVSRELPSLTGFRFHMAVSIAQTMNNGRHEVTADAVLGRLDQLYPEAAAA